MAVKALLQTDTPFPLESASLGFDPKALWGDPESGVSFAYLTNSRLADPWHAQRLDLVSNLVHTAIA